MWVDAPHFYAGSLWTHRKAGAVCTKAAPIIRWMEGKTIEEVFAYFRRKGWKCGWIYEEKRDE